MGEKLSGSQEALCCVPLVDVELILLKSVLASFSSHKYGYNLEAVRIVTYSFIASAFINVENM
jgi:hypothetical protein